MSFSGILCLCCAKIWHICLLAFSMIHYRRPQAGPQVSFIPSQMNGWKMQFTKDFGFWRGHTRVVTPLWGACLGIGLPKQQKLRWWKEILQMPLWFGLIWRKLFWVLQTMWYVEYHIFLITSVSSVLANIMTKSSSSFWTSDRNLGCRCLYYYSLPKMFWPIIMFWSTSMSGADGVSG